MPRNVEISTFTIFQTIEKQAKINEKSFCEIQDLPLERWNFNGKKFEKNKICDFLRLESNGLLSHVLLEAEENNGSMVSNKTDTKSH